MIYTVGIDSGSTATKVSCWQTASLHAVFSADPFRPADAINDARETLRADLAETPF